jgi:hypothetical protein
MKKSKKTKKTSWLQTVWTNLVAGAEWCWEKTKLIGAWLYHSGIPKALEFIRDKGRAVFGFVVRQIQKNSLDSRGRIDTGRIGQIIGLFLMVFLAKYLFDLAIANQLDKLDMTKVLGIGGPSGVLMTLYRLKDFAGTSGPKDDEGFPGGG